MTSILRTLRESDPALLTCLADVWKVKLDEDDDIAQRIDAISRAMLDPARAEAVWDALDDKRARRAANADQRQGQDARSQIRARLRRESGGWARAAMEREQPHKNPESIAEGLYFRGLIGQAFENADTGPRTIIYIPDDLVQILPAHKTSYDNLDDESDDDPQSIPDRRIRRARSDRRRGPTCGRRTPRSSTT